MHPEVTVFWDLGSILFWDESLWTGWKRDWELARLAELLQPVQTPQRPTPHSQWVLGPVKKILICRSDRKELQRRVTLGCGQGTGVPDRPSRPVQQGAARLQKRRAGILRSGWAEARGTSWAPEPQSSVPHRAKRQSLQRWGGRSETLERFNSDSPGPLVLTEAGIWGSYYWGTRPRRPCGPRALVTVAGEVALGLGKAVGAAAGAAQRSGR